VFEAVLRKSAIVKDDRSAIGLRDLEAVQRLQTSPVFMALFDIPWTPLFLLGIFIFHPWLGFLALGGGAVLVVIAIFNQTATNTLQMKSAHATFQSDAMSDQIRNEAELIRSLGMTGAAFNRWNQIRSAALGDQLKSANIGGGYSSLTKTLRLFLQSAMLGLGAYLILQNELTPAR
jgi:ABC-type protease/lipase transport system fused ATPase/permease subunit